MPSRSTVYRVLVRQRRGGRPGAGCAGLLEPTPRKRKRDTYRRWERSEPMQLWQMDIVGGIFLADGTELTIVTGIDDHSLPNPLTPRTAALLRGARSAGPPPADAPAEPITAERIVSSSGGIMIARQRI